MTSLRALSMCFTNWGEELIAVSGLDCESVPVWNLNVLWEESSDDLLAALPPRGDPLVTRVVLGAALLLPLRAQHALRALVLLINLGAPRGAGRGGRRAVWQYLRQKSHYAA